MSSIESVCNITCEWGAEGIQRALHDGFEAVIIVDVLSFCTSVEIAVGNGAIVYPYDMKGDTAQLYAHSLDAVCASPARSLSNYSLSPHSLRSIPSGTKLVLPSPNGSALSLSVGTLPLPAFAGCLRNAQVVAKRAQQIARRVAVIPAGERWEDGTSRFAVEDLIGAGAIISYLTGIRSPEAEASAAVFESFSDDLMAALEQCVSGRELIESGFARDVELAAQLNVSKCVPVVRDGAFVMSV